MNVSCNFNVGYQVKDLLSKLTTILKLHPLKKYILVCSRMRLNSYYITIHIIVCSHGCIFIFCSCSLQFNVTVFSKLPDNASSIPRKLQSKPVTDTRMSELGKGYISLGLENVLMPLEALTRICTILYVFAVRVESTINIV